MSFGAGDLNAIEGFAALLGVPAMAARDGSYSFLFDRSGTFTLTPAEGDGGILASLSQRPARVDAPLMRRALQQAGFDASRHRLLQASLAADDSLVLSVGIEANALSVPVLDDLLQHLIAQHSAMA